MAKTDSAPGGATTPVKGITLPQSAGQAPCALLPRMEAAWFAAAENAAGPYEARPGALSLNHCGSRIFLERTFGVDLMHLEPGDRTTLHQVKDAQGVIWTVRCLGNPLWFAFRDRTVAEIIDYIERDEDSLQIATRKTSVLALQHAAFAALTEVVAWRPEQPMSRSQRRAAKKRLTELMHFALAMLHTDQPGRKVRAEMERLQLRVRGLDYQGWIDRTYGGPPMLRAGR